jgi:hypothetical protein
MNLDAIEECLQRAAEQSSVWALVREADKPAWILVLGDESLVDVFCDADGVHLSLRAELGMVVDADQRNVINELVLRCTGVIPMPAITLGPDHRYETFTRWRIDLQDVQGLAALFEDITEQVKLWREVVNKPMADAPVAQSNRSIERAPDFGAFA